MAGNKLADMMRVKDLRDRILFTILMLVIYRLGVAIPIPGINLNALKLYFMAQEGANAIGITEYIDFFSGGGFKNFSIFMLCLCFGLVQIILSTPRLLITLHLSHMGLTLALTFIVYPLLQIP